MASPNILNAVIINGITTSINFSSLNNTLLISNLNSSNQLYKINSLYATNTGVLDTSITIKYFTDSLGAGTSFPIVNTVTIPTNSTLTVIGKDSPIYLTENTSICGFGSTTSITIISSYDKIS